MTRYLGIDLGSKVKRETPETYLISGAAKIFIRTSRRATGSWIGGICVYVCKGKDSAAPAQAHARTRAHRPEAPHQSSDVSQTRYIYDIYIYIYCIVSIVLLLRTILVFIVLYTNNNNNNNNSFIRLESV